MTNRTDFTSEIDGAMSSRMLGSRHFSDVARSGNGDMRTDLSDQSLKDYEELDGIGEGVEELSTKESAAIDTLGASANVPRFRWPTPGETPPFAAKPGNVWLKRRVITGSRVPGGNRVAKTKWVQVTKERLHAMRQDGQMNGMGEMSMTTIGISGGIGLVAGIALWMMLRKR